MEAAPRRCSTSRPATTCASTWSRRERGGRPEVRASDDEYRGPQPPALALLAAADAAPVRRPGARVGVHAHGGLAGLVRGRIGAAAVAARAGPGPRYRDGRRRADDCAPLPG